MVNSQADILVPGWKESILAIARNIVSCTRSSARSTFPHSEIAKARRLGTAARIELRTEAGLDLAAEFGRLGVGFLVAGGRGIHWLLLSHGFVAFVHHSTPTPFAHSRPRSPLWRLHKTRDMADGSIAEGTFLQRTRWRGKLNWKSGASPVLPRASPLREGFLTTSQSLGQHLPYLRRYARALSGSQASGDAYVAATLEALVSDLNVVEGAT